MFATYADFAAHQASAGMPKGDQTTMPIEVARALRNAYTLSLVKGSTGVRSSSDHLLRGPVGEFRVRMTVPRSLAGDQVVLFLRGSGHWSGTLETHDETNRALAHLTGLRVCAVDYHRIPEFRAPVQVQEAGVALEAVLEDGLAGGKASRVLLYGESAGANLALSLAVRERESRRLAGMALLYPAPFGPARHRAPGNYQWVWAHYLPPGEGASSSHVPVNHDLRGLCPAWIGAGEADALHGDAVELADLLKQAEVPTWLRSYPELPHAFIGMSTQLKPAQEALQDCAAALRRMSHAAPG